MAKKADASIYPEVMPKVSQDDKIINTARRSKWRVTANGVDITGKVQTDLISLEVKDVEDSEADDLQLKLADRDGTWLQNWLNETVQKGAQGAKGLKLSVTIGSQDHTGRVVEQNCGTFILDTMKHDGPPSVATIKATSVDFKKGIRTEKKSKTWKNLRLKKLTQTVAKSGGLKWYYQPKSNPKFKSVKQNDETMLAFLVRLCREKGYSVKICGNNMVVYEPAALEAASVVRTFTFGDGTYLKWSTSTGSADTNYDYCTVRYTNPKTGKLIKATYKDPSYKKNEKHVLLNITNKKVTSKSEAKAYAKAQLNLKNKFERTVDLTLIGNPAMMAGMTVKLNGFGYWTGKYMIHEATQSLSKSGYTTKLSLRYID